MREEQAEKLRATFENLFPSLEELEQRMQSLNEDSDFEAIEKKVRTLRKKLADKKISVRTLNHCRIKR